MALSLLDNGWYGQGIYFSSSAKYCVPYFTNQKHPVLFLVFVIPGNIYPVIEKSTDENSFCGKPIKSGYQSHYILTAREGIAITGPLSDEPKNYDELVISQDVQALPSYIISVDKTKVANLVEEMKREIYVPSGNAVEDNSSSSESGSGYKRMSYVLEVESE